MISKTFKMSKSGDGSTVGSFDSLEVRDESNLYGTTQVGTTIVPKNLLVNGNITATGTISGGGGLNATTLLGKTWAVPDPIGSTTPSTGSFTTLGSTNITGPIGSTTPSTGAFTSLSSTSSIQVSNPSTSAQILTTLAQPNLLVGQDPLIVVGKSATNFDSAVVQFEYNGAASTGNLAGLGPYGAPLLTVDGLGNTNVGGNLTVTGTINGGGSGGINAATLLGKTWASPDPIGSTTPSTGAFTSMTVSDPAASATYTTQTNSSSNAAASTGFKAFSDNCNILMETTSSTNTPASRGRVRTSTDAFGLDLETQGTGKSIRFRTMNSDRVVVEDSLTSFTTQTTIVPNVFDNQAGPIAAGFKCFQVNQPTITATNPLTVPYVATMYIGTPPVLVNVTSLETYSLYVEDDVYINSTLYVSGGATISGTNFTSLTASTSLNSASLTVNSNTISMTTLTSTTIAGGPTLTLGAIVTNLTGTTFNSTYLGTGISTFNVMTINTTLGTTINAGAVCTINTAAFTLNATTAITLTTPTTATFSGATSATVSSTAAVAITAGTTLACTASGVATFSGATSATVSSTAAVAITAGTTLACTATGVATFSGATSATVSSTAAVAITAGTTLACTATGVATFSGATSATVSSAAGVFLTSGTTTTVLATGAVTIGGAGITLNGGIATILNGTTVTINAATTLNLLNPVGITTVTSGTSLLLTGGGAATLSSGLGLVLLGGLIATLQSVGLVTIQTTPGAITGTGIFVDPVTGVRVVANGLTRFQVDGNGMDVVGNIRTPTLQIDSGGTSSLRAASAESLTITVAGSGTGNTPLQILQVALPNAGTLLAVFGKTNVLNNASLLTYTHTSDGSTSNSVSLGLVGNATNLTVNGTTVTVNGNLTVTGTASISGLDAATLLTKTWAIPNPIGSTTPSTGAFTTLSATTSVTTPDLLVSVAGSGSGNIPVNILQTALPNAGLLYSVFGKSNTANNAIVLTYAHTADASTSNSLTMALAGNATSLSINGTGTTVTGTINVTGAATHFTTTTQGLTVSNVSAASGTPASFLSPNLNLAAFNNVVFGRSITNFNCGYVQFNYNVASSTTNTFSFGVLGAPVFVLDGLGNATVNGNLTVTGTASISGLDAATLLTKTWAAPNPIGSTTPSTGAFTTLSATTSVTTPDLLVSVAGSGSGNIPVNILQTALPNAGLLYSVFGKSNTANNAIVLTYAHTADASTSNSLTMALAGNATSLSINGTGTTVTGTINVTGAATHFTTTTQALTVSNVSAASGTLATFLSPNLNLGAFNNVCFGRSISNFNTACVQFNYNVASSTTNTFSIGVLGAPQFILNGLGNATVNGTINVTGAATHFTTTTQGLFVSNAAATSLTLSTFLSPNLNVAAFNNIVLGRSVTNFNGAAINFIYNGASSTANEMRLGLLGAPQLSLFGTGEVYSANYFSSAVRPTYAIVLTNSTAAIAANTTANLLLNTTSVDGFASNTQGQAMFSISAGIITNVSGRSLDVHVTQQIIWDGTTGIGERSSYVQSTAGEIYCYGTAVTEYILVGLALSGVAYLQPCGGSQQFTIANGAGINWNAFNNQPFTLSVMNTKTVTGGTQRTRLTITVLN